MTPCPGARARRWLLSMRRSSRTSRGPTRELACTPREYGRNASGGGPPPRRVRRRLRVEPSEPRRLSHALHCDGLGGHAWIDLVGARATPDGIRSGEDLTAQSLVHLLEGPGERRAVLGPFEVADDD